MNLDQLLSEAAQRMAEQVDPPEVDLDVVRSRAHRAQRRKAAGVLGAAVVTAALIGIPLLATGHDTTAPQPAVSPRSEIIRTLRDADCAADRCLRPGVYGVPLGQDRSGQRLRARLTVEAVGWEANGSLHRLSRADAQGTVVLNVYQPHQFAGPQPCVADGATRRVEPDAAVDDVVDLLTTLPQFALLDGPRAVTAFGRDARYVQVHAAEVSCSGHTDPGVQYNLADIYGTDGSGPGGDSDIDPDQPVLIHFWVLELGGKPVVVEARQEGTPESATVRQLDQVRESLTFDIRQ